MIILILPADCEKMHKLKCLRLLLDINSEHLKIKKNLVTGVTFFLKFAPNLCKTKKSQSLSAADEPDYQPVVAKETLPE